MTHLSRITQLYTLIGMANEQEIEILHTYAGNLIRVPARSEYQERPKLPAAGIRLSSEFGWGSE